MLIAEAGGSASRPLPNDFSAERHELDDDAADRILDRLAAASRPLIVGGPAMTRGVGVETLSALSEATGVPSAASDSPRGINDPALGAFADVLSEADVLLLLGKRLDFTLSFGRTSALNAGCVVLQVDPEPQVLEQTERNLGDGRRLAVAAVSGPVAAAERLSESALKPETAR